ncbi:MAG: argininosuccinate lyase [Oscillospiraceae bacterium]|nr:argininosuccinate lyase [Oscillospiraceae bacterium]
MAKLWAGRTSGEIDPAAESYNRSISFDKRMWREDITASVAHAKMLKKQGLIPSEAADRIVSGLEGIMEDIESGRLVIDSACEDIHSFVEAELTAREGEAGKMLHTARSRNDQVAQDLRLYLRGEGMETRKLVLDLITALMEKADEEKATVMPGYTHLQRAQPVTFGHHLMAYAMMLSRDAGRLDDALRRMDESPIGACALAGTTYDTDRRFEAELLGFSAPMRNSLDAVSDRDYAVELLSALSLIMTHLSRFSEEIILWSSWEFRFISLSDAYSTGSSIMPQKKNPDMAELTRGKTGRVYGDLIALLTALKGIPLAYNKDMQEDKEAVFDAFDTVKAALTVFAPMISTMRVLRDNMRLAAQRGFINATDLADYLTCRGMPFRTAYKLVGEIVTYCSENGLTLEELGIEEYKKRSELFEQDLYAAIDIDTCCLKRTSLGGPTPESVDTQIAWLREKLGL